MPTTARRLLTSARTRRTAASPIAATDGELLMRFRRGGDPEALAEILDRHAAMVWGVCRNVLHREADAQDAFQATFLILLRRADSIRASESAAGWLYRVALRAACDARRTRLRRREAPLDDEPLQPEPAFPDIERRQLSAALMDELRALPTKYQTPLVLRYLEGLSRQEIADQLDTTVATVQGRLVRGKRQLRSRLIRRGVSLSVAMGVLAASRPAEAAPVGPVLSSGGAIGAHSAIVQQLTLSGARSMMMAAYAKPLAVAATIAIAAIVAAPNEEESLASNALVGPASNLTVQLDATPVDSDEEASVAMTLPVAAPDTEAEAPEPTPAPSPAATQREPAGAKQDAALPQQERVVFYQQLVERIRTLHDAGAPGGDAASLAMAERAHAEALAVLHHAKGEHEQAVEQRRRAVEEAVKEVKAVQESFDAGRVTLDLLMQAAERRAKAKQDLKRAEQSAGFEPVSMDSSQLTRKQLDLELQHWQMREKSLQLRVEAAEAMVAEQQRVREKVANSIPEHTIKNQQASALDYQAGLLEAQAKMLEVQQKLAAPPVPPQAPPAPSGTLPGPPLMPASAKLMKQQLDLELSRWRLKAQAFEQRAAAMEAEVARANEIRSSLPKSVAEFEIQKKQADRMMMQAAALEAQARAVEMQRRMEELQGQKSEAMPVVPERDQYGPDSTMKQGNWNAVHEPSELDPKGWAVIADLRLGEHMPVLLPGDSRPRPHLKLVRMAAAGPDGPIPAMMSVVDPGGDSDRAAGIIGGDANQLMVRGQMLELRPIGPGKRLDSVLVLLRCVQGRTARELESALPTYNEATQALSMGSELGRAEAELWERTKQRDQLQQQVNSLRAQAAALKQQAAATRQPGAMIGSQVTDAYGPAPDLLPVAAPTNGYGLPAAPPADSSGKVKAGDQLVLTITKPGRVGYGASKPTVVSWVGVVDSAGLLHYAPQIESGGEGIQVDIDAAGRTLAEVKEALQVHDGTITDVSRLSSSKETGPARPLISASPGASDQLDAMRKRLEEQGRLIEKLQSQLAAEDTTLFNPAPTGSTQQPNDYIQFATPPEAPSIKIEPGQRLFLEVTSLPNGYLEKYPGLNGQVTVEAEGTISLGAAWGRAEVAGLTLREAEETIGKLVKDGVASRIEMFADTDDSQQKRPLEAVTPKELFESIKEVRVQLRRASEYEQRGGGAF